MNNFEPSKQTIGELFQKNTSLTIPRYQRSYEWKLANIEDFYNDFVRVSQDRLNFLGNIVIDRSIDDERQIIDGQQRLITTVILVAAIRDFLREKIKSDEARDLANEIDTSFIKHGSFAQTDNLFRLVPAGDLKSFFQDYIQIGGHDLRASTNAKTTSEKNVATAYKKFRSLIEENIQTHHFDNLKKKVLELSEVSLIVIDIYNQDMAFAIFESFNAKRVDLSVSDLVKNYYFSRLGKNVLLNDATMDRWDSIIANVASVTTVDRFLYQFMQSYDGKFSKSILYRKIRAGIELDHQRFIVNLESNATILVGLKNADVGDALSQGNITQINNSLANLRMFNVEQCYILLLAVVRNEKVFSSKYLQKMFELVEHFTFIYSKIGNEQANVLEDVYSRYAKEIEEWAIKGVDTKALEDQSGKLYSRFQKELAKLIPGEEVFISRFIELDYDTSQKKIIKYIFTKLEEFRTKGGVALGYAANIDHVYPQNPPQGHKKPSRYNKIGNLVPIDSYTNSQIGNKLPTDKVEAYRKITNTEMKSLLEFIEGYGAEFDDTSINERGRQIAVECYRRWQLK